MRHFYFIVSLLFLLIVNGSNTYASHSEAKVTFLVKSSSQSLFQTELTIESDELFQSLLRSSTRQQVSEIPHCNNFILFEDRGEIQVLVMDSSGILYNSNKRTKIALDPRTHQKIQMYFKLLGSKHFGNVMAWEVVNEQIPKYSIVKITDIETGLSFHAQRRAGKNHADVQPVTRKDTEIMKRIYGGEWSWKRRGILVELNEQIFAASMHGMPHGNGALANGFPGHFCIHFKGSITHKTRNTDLSHQVMVYKAGGLLDEYVSQFTPQEVIELFFVALNQNDLDLLTLIYKGKSTFLTAVESVRIVNKDHNPTINTVLEFEMPVTYKIKEKGKAEQEQTFVFKVERVSPTGRWQLIQIPY
ncbi:hypothetical protein DS745_08140 [Anaerobacillus alkaliphilus]|uniref:Uncharacterized protein n=1 Tax=Anaerobacillus alkaliphilus TaxID=1548597 RepID=A0A4Q0VU67_9BACI|nr:hypothetical protein [Anaerobacillus alkaliphilus]RXJ02051.1 hypothetical protein DS745_08140 [Anaerobacillus alkaliphilus]